MTLPNRAGTAEPDTDPTLSTTGTPATGSDPRPDAPASGGQPERPDRPVDRRTGWPLRRHRWSVTGVAVSLVVIAAVTATAVTLTGPQRILIPGLPDAGPLTELLLPLMRGGADLSAALTIGWLLAAAWLVPPRRDRVLTVGGYRSLRAASRAATAWAVFSVLLGPLTVADVLGRPVADVLSVDAFLTGLTLLEPVQGTLISAAFAAAIAVCSRLVLRPGGAGLLLAIAVAGILPAANSGHSAQTRDHDIAVDSMLFHLIGVCVWVGGLVAVIGLSRQRIDHFPMVVRRYSAVAAGAFLLVAGSGLLNAAVRLPAASDLWNTVYGRLLLIKIAAWVVLGVVGWVHRRRMLPRLDAAGSTAFRRLAIVEALIMAVTVGIAAALSGTALPEASTPAEPNEQEMLLGYALSGPPTVWRLLGAWRFDWILGTAAVAAAAAYLVGVWVVRRRGDRWKAGRTIAWLSGCAVMLLATSSGFGRYAETQFSVHMSAHMMLAMVAPALLVLGGPVTLALRALPAAGRGGPPGARETLLAAVHSRPARIITHPLFVLPVFIGSFAAIYFTDLFSVLVSSHLGHLLMNVHFLLVGYLYYWLVIGIDPGPRRFSPPARLGFLMVPVPFHAFFGLVLMNTRMPLAGDYYTRLALPWVPDLVDDQRLGGAIAWASTEAPIAVVILALVVQWARSDEREARRSDRRGDRTDDELDAYNAMLADLSQRRPESSQLRQTSHADGASDEGAGHHRPGQVVADGPTAKQRAHTTHPEPSTGSGQ